MAFRRPKLVGGPGYIGSSIAPAVSGGTIIIPEAGLSDASGSQDRRCVSHCLGVCWPRAIQQSVFTGVWGRYNYMYISVEYGVHIPVECLLQNCWS